MNLQLSCLSIDSKEPDMQRSDSDYFTITFIDTEQSQRAAQGERRHE